jgi:hypothetical protein
MGHPDFLDIFEFSGQDEEQIKTPEEHESLPAFSVREAV